MITVHHLNYSRSQRVLWMLEELELPYELVKYERDPKTLLAPPALQAIHPLGKSPVITDDGQTIAESGAILEYLVETYGKGRFAPGVGTPERLQYRYFMHYAEGSLMPFLLLKLIFRKITTAPLPFFVKPIARKIAGTVSAQFIDPNLTRHLEFLTNHLAKQPWFAGPDFTAADIQMSFPVESAAARAGALGATAPLTAFIARCKARPAYQRAIDRGGPNEMLD